MKIIDNLKAGLGIKEKGQRPVSRMGWIDFWDNYYAQTINKGYSERKVQRDYGLYGDVNTLFSGKENVAYIYYINGYPEEIELSYKTSLRRVCKSGIRINFVGRYNRDFINWSDPKIKRQTEIWDSIEKNQKIRAKGRNAAVFESSQQKQKDKRSTSLMYLYDATRERGRKLFLTRQFLIVAGTRGEVFDKSIEDIEKEAKEIGLVLTRVSSNLQNFIRYMSPTSMRTVPSVENVMNNTVITDEILSRFNTYDQGYVGKGSLILGLSIKGKNLVLMEPKTNPTDAENWLVAGETGSGKSYMSKSILNQLLARDDINGTINDIEGQEYTGQAEFTARLEKVVRVNLSAGSGQYIDPVEMHMTGDPELDDQMYDITKSFTLSILKTYIGEALLKESAWASIMLKASLNKFYSDLGVVDDDPRTWVKTMNKKQFDIYPYLIDYTPRGFVGVKEYIRLCEEDNEPVNRKFLEDRDEIKAQLDIYLSEEARNSKRYANPVSIADLKDAKLVVVSFGMAGKSENQVDPIDMGLMQIYASQISYLRSIFSLQQGKFNVKVWEELQRWGDFPGSDEVLKVALSGGRKLGDINILIINRLGEVVNNDRFGILESVQSFAIGAIGNAEVRAKLCQKLSIQHMLPELDKIAEAKDKETKGEQYIERDYATIMQKPYSKAFIVGIDRAEFTTSKVMLPKSISDTKMFQTGVDTGLLKKKELL